MKIGHRKDFQSYRFECKLFVRANKGLQIDLAEYETTGNHLSSRIHLDACFWVKKGASFPLQG